VRVSGSVPRATVRAKGSADDFDVVDGSGRIVAASSSQAAARGMTCTPQGGLSLPSLKS